MDSDVYSNKMSEPQVGVRQLFSTPPACYNTNINAS